MRSKSGLRLQIMVGIIALALGGCAERMKAEWSFVPPRLPPPPGIDLSSESDLSENALHERKTTLDPVDAPGLFISLRNSGKKPVVVTNISLNSEALGKDDKPIAWNGFTLQPGLSKILHIDIQAADAECIVPERLFVGIDGKKPIQVPIAGRVSSSMLRFLREHDCVVSIQNLP